MKKSNDEAFQKVMRKFHWEGFRNILIEEIILSVIWGFVGQILPEGNLMAVVNIVFLLVSIFLAWAMSETLRGLRVSSLISISVSAILWVLIFSVLRGFL